MSAFVYILASKRYGTLYIGVTANLARRIFEHREGLISGFTKRHGIKRLVHAESFAAITDAIAREKTLKDWHRDWKIRLIEENNPMWDDLAVAWFNMPPLPERPRRTPMLHRD